MVLLIFTENKKISIKIFFKALDNDCKNIATYLLDKGANFEEKDENGDTALIWGKLKLHL